MMKCDEKWNELTKIKIKNSELKLQTNLKQFTEENIV